jgi:phosphoribosyl-AMP cyclohydrolase / phosphoribosyl-ATP pyrophosphohydrolase
VTAFDASKVKYDERGLVPVVAQEATTGEVLMLAWANREALESSLRSGRMHYWSRSRAKLWEKGEESGHRQQLVRLAVDCDGDAVLAQVRQTGPACHTNVSTCFGRDEDDVPRPTLSGLAQVLGSRRTNPPAGSYTAKLLADPKLASKKVGEEATELVMALASESEDRVAEEAADLVYHALVACQGRGVALPRILEVLEKRRR